MRSYAYIAHTQTFRCESVRAKNISRLSNIFLCDRSKYLQVMHVRQSFGLFIVGKSWINKQINYT